MKRVILIHGWGGNPDEAWMPHFKTAMRERGYEVIAPEMPDADEPRIEPWVAKVSEAVGQPDGDTHLVGHSIGCQTIQRYLAGLPDGIRVGHVVFVTPWFNLKNLEEAEKPVAEPWLRTPIDTDAVRRVTEDITAIFSDDDPVVPLSDADLFRERLDAHVIVLHNKGHMGADSGVEELPEALEVFR